MSLNLAMPIELGWKEQFPRGLARRDLRRSRYIGLAKTYLQHVATACAINLSRLMAWFQQVPQAKTRISRFAAVDVKAQADTH
jgi:transposase